MSFRLKIVLMTTVLMTLLFSIGGTVLIHTSFQTSMEKEEDTMVKMNEMILRVVAYVGSDGKWIDKVELAEIVGNLSQQDNQDGLLLRQGDEIIFANRKVSAISQSMNEITDLEEDYVQISYFSTRSGENYLQTTTGFVLNGRDFSIDICRNLSGIYAVREQQMRLFQNIFLLFSMSGILLSWLFATLITRHLRKLTKASKEIGAGNLSYRSRIESEDEVGELSKAFDNMAERMEMNISLLKEAAEQKEMFMGAFTHELKTPMTSIIGYADLLRTQKLSKKDQADALDYIFSEGKRLENMSLKMLDLFVVDKNALTLKLCSPSDLVNYSVRHLRKEFAKANVEIEVKAEEGTCLLEADLFQTLVINLLDNARKAMEAGGKITVGVEMTEDGCVLYVMDEGNGIPEESLKHLTEAFYRVDKARARSKGSAGLGLALCDKIVELHHGELRFASKEGVGTVVTACLNGGRYNEET